MAEGYWNTTTKKVTVSGGMGVLGYQVVQPFLNFLPKMPTWVTDPFIGQISLVTIAGVATLYGVYLLWSEY